MGEVVRGQRAAPVEAGAAHMHPTGLATAREPGAHRVRVRRAPCHAVRWQGDDGPRRPEGSGLEPGPSHHVRRIVTALSRVSGRPSSRGKVSIAPRLRPQAPFSVPAPRWVREAVSAHPPHPLALIPGVSRPGSSRHSAHRKEIIMRVDLVLSSIILALAVLAAKSIGGDVATDEHIHRLKGRL